MRPAYSINEANLRALAGDLMREGVAVTAPVTVRGKCDYRALTEPSEMVLEGDLPRRSLKEFFLPPTEPVVYFQLKRQGVELKEVKAKYPTRVILAARPCDAAGVEVMDKVMGWDYRDEPWFGRREATTVVAMACPGGDDSCFCTRVGLSPDSPRGSDAVLVPAGRGVWRYEPVTDKGEALVKAHPSRFDADGGAEAAQRYRDEASRKASAQPQVKADAVRTWLAGHFEHPYWNTVALRCHGCGACASVCPTCHCFDIVDEMEGHDRGTRRRNWDTCQTGRFTVHASGHNPRDNQHARYRQRVNHKFQIYPRRFGEVLCTGCGRCSRACPGGMDLLEVLGDLTRLGEGAARESR